MIPLPYQGQVMYLRRFKSRNIGYDYMTDFAAGNLMEGSTISWKGKDGNLTYKYLENLLFEPNYTTLDVKSASEKTIERTDYSLETTFLLPYGYCFKLLGVKPKDNFRFESANRVSIFLVDPARANNIRTEGTAQARTEIGPITQTTWFTGKPLFKLLYCDCKNTMFN